jgi:hypothetical protein
MMYLDEDKVRELVEEAVRRARNTTPGNMSDEAVVQWTMDDKYIDGRWRSAYFTDWEMRHELA